MSRREEIISNLRNELLRHARNHAKRKKFQLQTDCKELLSELIKIGIDAIIEDKKYNLNSDILKSYAKSLLNTVINLAILQSADERVYRLSADMLKRALKVFCPVHPFHKTGEQLKELLKDKKEEQDQENME